MKRRTRDDRLETKWNEGLKKEMWKDQTEDVGAVRESLRRVKPRKTSKKPGENHTLEELLKPPPPQHRSLSSGDQQIQRVWKQRNKESKKR